MLQKPYQKRSLWRLSDLDKSNLEEAFCFAKSNDEELAPFTDDKPLRTDNQEERKEIPLIELADN